MPKRLIEIVLLLVLCVAGCKRSSTPPQQGAPDPSARNKSGLPSEEFIRLMNAGKNYLDQGDATNAIATYRHAEEIVANDPDLHLNLANAYLSAGIASKAIDEARRVLTYDPNSAAAYFVAGSAHLRLGQAEEAVKALENSRKIEPGVTATFFQLGVARMGMKQWEEAISAFREGLETDPNHLHAPVHYLLAQSLLRAGHSDEAERELQEHQLTADSAPNRGAATFERSKFTQARVPFRLDQPTPTAIKITFTDATHEALTEIAQRFSGPVGLIDPTRTGLSSLVVHEVGTGFRLLWNKGGRFEPADAPLAAETSKTTPSKVLVGDLQNDRVEDVIILGTNGSRLFRFNTNGLATDLSETSHLQELKANDGILLDLDFTGKLDLVVVGSETNNVRLFRQFGPFLFNEVTRTSGIPSSLRTARKLTMDDWNRDEIMDVIVSRNGASPLLLEKQRGGPLAAREMTGWPAGEIYCSGDFDNDLRPDLAIIRQGRIVICLNNGEQRVIDGPALDGVQQIVAVDYDNDGWLDLWTVGTRIRAWRNLGISGFKEQTVELGLDRFADGSISEIHFADFDQDCDSDAVLTLANGGLRYLRNDGGNANSQVKVQLLGNRSNASGLGCKVEIESGGLRLLRTVQQLPVEIGVGQNAKLDSFLVHWFNWPQGSVDVPVNCREPLVALELTIQEGSCPYLYAWDGSRFRFVTDILGAAPLGLPVAEGVYIDSVPQELVHIGDENSFPSRDGFHELRITEELREVLYLDEAKLVVVDHEPGTEVYSTDKLLPAKARRSGDVITVHRPQPLQAATDLEGRDVKAALAAMDGIRLSPRKLLGPQLRGLAEPHGIVLDFGPLDATKPLVLVLNGWLRFGGGMANISASHDPSLPFPFPTLEGEVAAGSWKPVPVVVGAPAGKTKTIVVDLEGKLEPGTRRLRLREAFEIYWDRIALFEKKRAPKTHVAFVAPTEANLHFRGFSALKELPPDCPITPDYDRVTPNFYWTLAPGGWCTRYGDVAELIAQQDEGLALINSGDELSLRFAEAALPPKPAGTVREFFLYSDGWDKDSDFHVATGTQVEPLPFHSMDDQLYGREKRPPFPSDALHQKYNTRWVEGTVLKQMTRR